MESQSSCGYDYLELGDSSLRLCGYDVAGFTFVSSGNVVTITFHTDGSVTYRGFMLFYEAVEAAIASDVFGEYNSYICRIKL